MAEITASDSRTRKKRSVRALIKHSTRVDLTPMVDLGFLLITFFVFTTSMAEPKAMDLLEPDDRGFHPTKNSGTLTFILDAANEVFYYQGIFKEEGRVPQLNKTNLASVRNLILDMKQKTDPDFLMFQIKSTDKSTLGNHIALLDEFTVCAIPSGHFAEVALEDEELKYISSYLPK